MPSPPFWNDACPTNCGCLSRSLRTWSRLKITLLSTTNSTTRENRIKLFGSLRTSTHEKSPVDELRCVLAYGRARKAQKPFPGRLVRRLGRVCLKTSWNRRPLEGDETLRFATCLA